MSTPGPGLLVVAPLRAEAAAVRGGLRGVPVVRAGVRARRRSAVVDALTRWPGTPVVVVGVAGAVTPHTRPGDLVVADELRADGWRARCAAAPALAAALRASGTTVHVGPVADTARPVWRLGREHAPVGAVAVDMESARVWELAGPRTRAVVRAVVDTPDRPLVGPHTVPGGIAALVALRRAGPVLRRWAEQLNQTVDPGTGEEVRYR